MHEAFYVATTGRPGPVVIDLPKDIVIAKAPYVGPSEKPHRSYRPVIEPATNPIDEAISLLSVGVDFAVTQVVDGNWGVHAVIRKALFSGGSL